MNKIRFDYLSVGVSHSPTSIPFHVLHLIKREQKHIIAFSTVVNIWISRKYSIKFDNMSYSLALYRVGQFKTDRTINAIQDL